MYVPKEGNARDAKLKRILNQCLNSQNDRQSLYDRRRRYFLFGSYRIEGPGVDEGTRHNRLGAYTDLVASFLYAADHAKFSVSAPRNAEDAFIKQVAAVEDYWNDTFRDTGTANRFGEGVLWSTVYDSMFLKLGWNDARRELFPVLVEPHSFGVWNEREPDLDSQEAFVHTYALDWDNAALRLARAGKVDQLRRIGTISGPKVTDYPPVLSNLIISSTGGRSITGPIIGQATPDYNIRASYEATGTQTMIRFHEVWVWDDVAEDYASFLIADPDIVLSDSRETIAAMAQATAPMARKWAGETNIFLPGEHPFVQIRPYPLYNYFWGESFVERVIALQDWSNDRLAQIAAMLEKQVDPAKVFSGFMGLSDEKAGLLGGPGSWVVDQLPGAKVEELAPKMPEDLFREYKQIGEIFLEMAGLTGTIAGQNAEGVRGDAHFEKMAKLGSSRIRKTAVMLEDPLAKLGDIGLKLVQRNDPTKLTADDSQELIPAQVGEDYKIRIAGHSHSPLFADETRETALTLRKLDAIDNEELIRALNPPNADALIHSLRSRQKAKAELIQQHPELLAHEGGKGKKAA